MKKIFPVVLYCVGVAAIILLLYNQYFSNSKPISYINGVKLFEGFKGKQDVNAKIKTLELQNKGILDSLYLQIAILENAQADALQIEKNKVAYITLKQELDEAYDETVNRHHEEIWKQINQYIYEYGKQHNHHYILGAVGNGSLMYANDEFDITDDVLIYINNKYDGK